MKFTLKLTMLSLAFFTVAQPMQPQQETKATQEEVKLGLTDKVKLGLHAAIDGMNAENSKAFGKKAGVTVGAVVLPVVTYKLVGMLPEKYAYAKTAFGLVAFAELAYGAQKYFAKNTIQDFNNVVFAENVTEEALVNAYTGLSKNAQDNFFVKQRFTVKYKELTGKDYQAPVVETKAEAKLEVKPEQPKVDLKPSEVLAQIETLQEELKDLNAKLEKAKKDSTTATGFAVEAAVKGIADLEKQIQEKQAKLYDLSTSTFKKYVDSDYIVVKNGMASIYNIATNKWTVRAVSGLTTAAVIYDIYKNGFNDSYTKAFGNKVLEKGQTVGSASLEFANARYENLKTVAGFIGSYWPSWKKEAKDLNLTPEQFNTVVGPALDTFKKLAQ